MNHITLEEIHERAVKMCAESENSDLGVRPYEAYQ